MKKSITTRFKVTGTGKVLRRKKGQCHFKAKKSSKQLYRKRGEFEASHSMSQNVTKDQNQL